MVDLGYSGQGSPVHARTADVEMSPVDHPERGEEVAFGQRRHVHIVDLGTLKQGVREKQRSSKRQREARKIKTGIKEVTCVPRNGVKAERNWIKMKHR